MLKRNKEYQKRTKFFVGQKWRNFPVVAKILSDTVLSDKVCCEIHVTTKTANYLKPSNITHNQQKPPETTRKLASPEPPTTPPHNEPTTLLCFSTVDFEHDFIIRKVELQKQPPEVFREKDVLKNFPKLTGKHLCWSLFFNNGTPTQVFFYEFCEVFRAHFLQNTSRWLLLYNKKKDLSTLQIFTYLNIRILRIVIYFLRGFIL